MHRAVKGTKICSVPRIFKTNCELFMCAKGKHKTKRESYMHCGVFQFKNIMPQLLPGSAHAVVIHAAMLFVVHFLVIK